MCDIKEGSDPKPMQPRPRRVLIIDDEPHIREAVYDILDLAGVETVQAATGASALQRFSERPSDFGLIFLDLSMPGMSGEDTLAALRLVDDQIPIIITSGHPPGDLSPDVAKATHGFLQKPFSINGLISLTESYLRNSPSGL